MRIAVILARQAAMREVKRRRQTQGIKGLLPFSTLSRLANEWLAAHPELIAEAAASPIAYSSGCVRSHSSASLLISAMKSHLL
jgi:hypothetical protein